MKYISVTPLIQGEKWAEEYLGIRIHNVTFTEGYRRSGAGGVLLYNTRQIYVIDILQIDTDKIAK